MFPLGVLKKPPFVGTALDIDTTVFPFLDKTGRHLIANSGVTLLLGAAHFPNNTQSSTNYLRITDNPLDFKGNYIVRGFKITMVFKLDGFPSSDNILFRLKNVGNSNTSDFYVKSSGAFVYYNNLSSYISATGLIQVGIEYTLEVISIGNAYVSIYLNSILLTTNIFGLSPTGREINIGALTIGFGGDPSLNGYGFQGSLSQFKYDITY